MAAFKRPGSRLYWIGPFRAGAVDVPRMSTKQTDKRVARAIEDALRNRAVTGYADLVGQVAEKTLDVAEFYTAHVRGPEALEELRLRASDKPIATAVAAFRPLVKDARILSGLDQLLALTPAGSRLSWLKSARNLSSLYARAEAGEDRGGRARTPNSVRRSLHRAVSDLLRHELGRGQMLAIMADVRKPGENDERVVILTKEEIAGALRCADYEFYPALGLALTTGIDRKAMLRLRVRDFDEDHHILYIPDTKAEARRRKVEIDAAAESFIRLAVAGRTPEEPMFDLGERQLRDRWEAVRERIGRPDVRWKDLRGIFATYFLEGGGSPRDLQHIMGHSSLAMTLRYIRRLPVKAGGQMGNAAERMGLGRAHLQLEKGGTA